MQRKVAKDLSPYCFRHEYCTDLCRRGVDIRKAQHLMGHSTIQLTASIYTNLVDDDMVTVAKMLQAVAVVLHGETKTVGICTSAIANTRKPTP